MTLLRNLLLSVVAFVVAGYGFYAYLLQAYPPNQLKGRADLSSVGTPADATQNTAGRVSDGVDIGALASAFSSVFPSALPASPGAEASANTTPPVVNIPPWLSQHLDQEAVKQGKSLSPQEKSQLVATLMDLREMSSKAIEGGGVPSDRTSLLSQPGQWGVMARAMQGEVQFRSILGIGLAEFVKKLEPQELERLLSKQEREQLTK